MSRWGTLPVLLGVAHLAPLLVPGLSAQRVRSAEAQALRDAGTHETRGRLTEAEAILQQLLEEQPTSAGGLFALERVLRSQGRVVAVLPAADRFLSAVPDASGVRYLKLRVLAEVDSVDAMVRETESWMLHAPADPLFYRQALPLWERTYGPERALDLLGRARLASGDPIALALEVGDLLMSAGRTADAAVEWARTAGSAGERGGGDPPPSRADRQYRGTRPRRGRAGGCVGALLYHSRTPDVGGSGRAVAGKLRSRPRNRQGFGPAARPPVAAPPFWGT